MNLGTIISWITSNLGLVTQAITLVEKVATDLQNIHGTQTVEAYAQGILAAVDSFFTSLGVNTSPGVAQSATIQAAVAAVPLTPPGTPAADRGSTI